MYFRWTFCALTTVVVVGSLCAEDGVTVIALSVEAKAAPKPALKYRLLPPLKDMQSGNPIQGYLKCLTEQDSFFHEKKAVADREKWQMCPLAELPDNLMDYGGIGLRQADEAARLDACDWQILNKLRTDGVNLLLPDVQQLRTLAYALKVRYRAQVKARKFDEAIKTHQTMFALARHLGEHPTLICDLVGIAVAGLAIGPFEEMIQQPGCPNFYWALAQLPSSFIDIRKGIQGERVWLAAGHQDYVDPSRVWSEDDLFKVRDKAKQYYGSLGGSSDEKMEKWIVERKKDQKWLADARRGLIAVGLREAWVEKYPPEQVIFHKLLTKFEVGIDERTKWVALPYWQAEPEMLEAVKPNLDGSEEDTIIRAILPAVRQVRMAQARTDQRIAMLQIIEALRLHAADHDGKLPASLEDVTVPLPINPFSGRAFNYILERETAILLSTPPKGQEKNKVYNFRYEVKIRK
jgi:hypothetical protein